MTVSSTVNIRYVKNWYNSEENELVISERSSHILCHCAMSEEVPAINKSSNHTDTSETKIESEREAVNIEIFAGTGSGGTSSSESEPEKGKETKGKKVGNGTPKDQVIHHSTHFLILGLDSSLC